MRLRISIRIQKYDFRIGFFYSHKSKVLVIALLPMIIITVWKENMTWLKKLKKIEKRTNS